MKQSKNYKPIFDSNDAVDGAAGIIAILVLIWVGYFLVIGLLDLVQWLVTLAATHFFGP